MSDTEPLLRVDGLVKHFPVRSGLLGDTGSATVKAVDGVSFQVRRGETLALVGESGCGKTTAGRALLRLIEPTAGSVSYAGEDVVAASGERLKQLRRQMQIIFQDPYASLNPRMTVGNIIGEALKVHRLAHGHSVRERVAEVMQRVGLAPDLASRYPHQFSGGQRQRIGIARALVLGPGFVVCDEAVSALDVSIQAQIINLLRELQHERGLSYLFITHDLNVVRHIAHRVAVMYLGRIVETGATEALFEQPRHPYTQALIAANPVPDPALPAAPAPLQGDVPSPLSPPTGCAFHPRCPRVMVQCADAAPPETRLGEHLVSCHLYPGEADRQHPRS